MSEGTAPSNGWSISFNPVVTPDWDHKVFPEYKSGLDLARHLEGDDDEDEDDEDRDETAREENENIWKQPHFSPQKIGSEQAHQSTITYLEEGDFHFRDARVGMEDFLKKPFPCGTRPCEKMKRLRVYVRADDFLEWAGWGDDDEDYGDAGIPSPGFDFEWEERQNDVYENIHEAAMRLPQITFPAQPHITIVIVTPIDRYGAEYLDDACITLNFVEATLEAYTKLKRTGATVNVVSVMSGQIERETAPTASISDLDITWLFELEENQCEKVPFQLLPRLNLFMILIGCRDATKESILAMFFLEKPPPYHHAALRTRSLEMLDVKMEEYEREKRRRA